jgi:hypothetical protein
LSNFEIPYLSDINDISFSYNSKIGLYLISFTVNDLNGTPYVYEHKFKLGDIDTFTETLISKVYSLKGGDDESFKWNDKPQPVGISTIPHNNKLTTLNTIWEAYDGKGEANTGFKQDEIDFTDLNNANVIWKSYVYDWDGFNYSLSKTRKVTGNIEFRTGSIGEGKHSGEFTFIYNNLILDRKKSNDTKWKLYTHSGNKYDAIDITVKRDLLGYLQGDNTI